MPDYPLPKTWRDRSSKDAARTAVLNAAPRPLHTSLSLPGADMIDTREAARLGLASRFTRNIFVERERDVAEKIEYQLKTDPALKDYAGGHLHYGDLASLNLSEALVYHRKLQFANLDLCGLINKPEAQFLFDMADDDVLADDAVIAVTTYTTWRTYNFGKTYREHRFNWLYPMEDIFDDLAAAAAHFGHSHRTCYQNILHTLEMVYGCLWRYEFKLHDLIVYKDSSEMSVMILKRIRHADPQSCYARRNCFSNLLDRKAYSQRAPETSQFAKNRIEDLLARV